MQGENTVTILSPKANLLIFVSNHVRLAGAYNFSSRHFPQDIIEPIYLLRAHGLVQHLRALG